MCCQKNKLLMSKWLSPANSFPLLALESPKSKVKKSRLKRVKKPNFGDMTLHMY